MSVESAARKELKAKLELCTEAQIGMFNAMYGTIEKIPFEKMLLAEKQIDRTLEKNKTRLKVKVGTCIRCGQTKELDDREICRSCS
jgi:hypothetical protein